MNDPKAMYDEITSETRLPYVDPRLHCEFKKGDRVRLSPDTRWSHPAHLFNRLGTIKSRCGIDFGESQRVTVVRKFPYPSITDIPGAGCWFNVLWNGCKATQKTHSTDLCLAQDLGGPYRRGTQVIGVRAPLEGRIGLIVRMSRDSPTIQWNREPGIHRIPWTYLCPLHEFGGHRNI